MKKYIPWTIISIVLCYDAYLGNFNELMWHIFFLGFLYLINKNNDEKK